MSKRGNFKESEAYDSTRLGVGGGDETPKRVNRNACRFFSPVTVVSWLLGGNGRSFGHVTTLIL